MPCFAPQKKHNNNKTNKNNNNKTNKQPPPPQTNKQNKTTNKKPQADCLQFKGAITNSSLSLSLHFLLLLVWQSALNEYNSK